jgi:hypothetical protein
MTCFRRPAASVEPIPEKQADCGDLRELAKPDSAG